VAATDVGAIVRATWSAASNPAIKLP